MSKTKSYFDSHAHVHTYHNDPKMYYMVMNLIKTNYIKGGSRFLDLGCGDGTLIKSSNSVIADFQFLGTDVSYEMIKMAQDNLRGINVDFIVCDGFNLPIKNEIRFDFIHSAYVLHHLIGPTKGKSLNLVAKLLRILRRRLSDNGILIIQEVYYDSYIIPSLTSRLLFYMLKLLNFLNLDISAFIKEFQLGLEVNFMHTSEIKNVLEQLEGKARMIGKDKLVLKQRSSNILSARRPLNTSLDTSKFSESLNQSKPLTLDQGLSEFIRNIKVRSHEGAAKSERDRCTVL